MCLTFGYSQNARQWTKFRSLLSQIPVSILIGNAVYMLKTQIVNVKCPKYALTVIGLQCPHHLKLRTEQT
jgi:hypothetical protein